MGNCFVPFVCLLPFFSATKKTPPIFSFFKIKYNFLKMSVGPDAYFGGVNN